MKNLVLVLFLLGSLNLFSQELSEDCKKNLGLTEMYAQQNMNRDAANFFTKAYEACGMQNLSKANWNNAKIIYTRLEKDEKDEARKKEILDTIFWVYDQGLTYGSDPDWEADYATLLVRYNSSNIEKIDALYASSIHKLKEKLSVNHIQFYFNHLIQKFNNAKDAEKEAARMFAIEEYLILSDYISKAISLSGGNEKKIESYKKAQEFMDKYFVKLAEDCTMLTDVFAKKITNLPTNKDEKIAKIKSYLEILDGRGCGKSDLYGQFADSLIAVEPSAEAYYSQGNFFLNKGENKKALSYFEKALEMEGNGENKGKYTYAIANMQYTMGSYTSAFRTAKSVEGEYRGKAMLICAASIAKMANNCGDTTFERKANYWLANDYVNKAIALGEKSQSSSTYLSNAPTDGEIFDENKSRGSSITLTCWGESTIIR